MGTFALSAYTYATEIKVNIKGKSLNKVDQMVQWVIEPKKGGPITVLVKVSPGREPAGKVTDLRNALFLARDELRNKGVTVVGPDLANATLTIHGANGVHKFDDNTGEKENFWGPKPKEGRMSFHVPDDSAPAGIDWDGLESQFQASLGFDDVLVDVSLNFSDLSGNTINDLLTDIYNGLLAGLPVAYAPNLSLDLSNGAIMFMFPIGVSQGFVENFTSDVNVLSGLSLEVLPEPSMLSLLAISAVGFGYMRRSRRNSKTPLITGESA
jgi:hypothetical protein